MVVIRFSHEIFRALLFVSNDRFGAPSPRVGRSRSKITVAAALNFGAAFSATPLPKRTGGTQLTPVLGLDPNTDPGLAGETGVSRD
jgi:hypothetical protein